MALRVPPCLSGLDSSFLFNANTSFSDVPQFLCPATYWRPPWLHPGFGNYNQRCYKHPRADFHVDISFHLLWVNTKEWDCRIIWQESVECKKLPNCLPFCIPASGERGSWRSAPSPALGVVRISGFRHSVRCAVVSHCCFICISLMTHEGEPLYICLFVICISSLVRSLGSGLLPFFN